MVLIDALCSALGMPSVIMLNVAMLSVEGNKYKNNDF